jgi:hypothetical protein
MVKLKHLKCYDAALVPDHIVQQVDEACEKMLSAMSIAVGSIDTNILLSAFNRAHAITIMHLISSDPEHLRNATLCEAKTLIKNVEFFSKVEMLPPDCPS